MLGLLAVTIALAWGDVSPFPVVVTVGCWLVGAAIRSQRELDRSLRVRAYELAAGRALYVAEAVRYERIRIARELHDIIAHSLSVIVIQASAGQRLPTSSEGGRERLGSARHHERAHRPGPRRSGRVGPVARRSPGETAPTLTRESIDDLVARVAATGSPLLCTLSYEIDDLPGGPTGAIVYRVLQEGLTNAIKHAPGAAIDVRIGSPPTVEVAIVNGASRATRPPSEPVPGAGRGIAGLTERVAAAGGTLTSGPTSQGGWQVRAHLPL